MRESFIASSAARMQRLRYTFRAMACDNVIEMFCADRLLADDAAAQAIAEVTRIEAKYSRYRGDSVVANINRAAGQNPIEVDAETALLLDYADACFHQSDGLFDITSGVLRKVWNFKPGEMTVLPSTHELAPILQLIGWDRVTRSREAQGTQKVMLPDAGMELDFGGFGKEYAADRAAAVLLSLGMNHAFVNLGGDVVVTGPQANGDAWQLGIQRPRVPGEVIASLPIYTGAIATSGDYERYVIINGVRHSHLLNPRTGLPVQGLQSATVFAPTCLVAGSIATIAMLKGGSRAWLRNSGADYLAVDAEGGVFTSPALRAGMRKIASTNISSKQ
jgi:FAD:protein FMN transferase